TATARFAAAIRRVSDEALSAPMPRPRGKHGYRLASLPGYAWTGRDSSPYKDASDLAFQGIRRVELVGKFGEASHTDLRYFEIQPGGYSSFERHVHGHIVIGARGEGVLVRGQERSPLALHDEAYIAPLVPHQLRNESDAA